MHESWLLFILLTAIVAFAAIAKRFELPYPIVFVVGGSALAFFPSLPSVRINPEWVFLIILPPLLYAGGWSTDWTMFRRYIRAISLLAIGLVVVTTGAVAIVAHHLVPGLSWAAAFALGAIVSPPDAVAAGAVFERFSVPRRIATILDGEGLVNDATALVLYRFAIAAALGTTFTIAGGAEAFVAVSVGGIALGFGFGAVTVGVAKLMRRFALNDYLLDSAITLIAPYAVYLFTDAIQIGGIGPSPVLATVTAGIFVSRQSAKIFDPDSRLIAYSVWELLIFLLNGLVFITIGLQLRTIVTDPNFVSSGLWVGIAISVLVIVVRIAWVYPATYLPRLLSRKIREREPFPAPNYVFIVAWSGMRGIVSLAAALALPYDFPARNTIFFVAFCVIFSTLVFQGLTLMPILKLLRIDSDEDLAKREIEVRVQALRAGVQRMRELEPTFDSTEYWEVEGRILGEYEYRIVHLLSHIDGKGAAGEPVEIRIDHHLEAAALEAERAEILRLRSAGEIPDEVYRKIEYDLDLANARMT
jgi:CPA1 family monovalent cation:H+ antiporter